jgi:bifunctional non-homologous end joining protein LigD
MADKLSDYRRKRDFKGTPEPAGGEDVERDAGRFVIQEHHARRLHWDFRLERDGVLVSWALPKGVPDDPKRNHLAVHVEDHPLSYIDFEGEIPEGNYGAGKVMVWDHGTYDCHKFRDDKVIVTLHGERVEGKYSLFRTRGDDWLIHRMDPPADPDREPMPERVEPMLAKLAKELPRDDSAYAYEIKWDGIRAILYSESGRVRIESRNLKDITSRWPELRALGRELGSRDAILDGEIVTLDEQGRPSFQRLQSRMHLASESAVRRRMKEVPAAYMVFDLLYLEGRSLMDLPYVERRELLGELDLNGPTWKTPAYHRGDGDKLLEAAAAQGLEGVVAKRLDSRYVPGRRGDAWLKVKKQRSQELVVGGWTPGEGRRRDRLGALLVGHYKDGQLVYAGKVGTGFTEETLKQVGDALASLERKTSPFDGRQPPRGSIFVEPKLVAEVEFSEWTNAGTIRHPSFKGLRYDKDARDVVREEPVAPPG